MTARSRAAAADVAVVAGAVAAVEARRAGSRTQPRTLHRSPAARASRRRRPARRRADEDDEVEIAPAPRGPRTNPFGSVWDSQIGTPASAAAATRAPLVDEEDFDEPEIPEYLIAERNRGGNRGGAGAGRGGGARGGRGAYQSAMDRERYGRGGAGGGVGGGGGGINRYPDVSGRTRSTPAAARGSRVWPGRRPSGRRTRAAQLERAVERRPARARSAASRPGGAEAGAEPPGTIRGHRLGRPVRGCRDHRRRRSRTGEGGRQATRRSQAGDDGRGREAGRQAASDSQAGVGLGRRRGLGLGG